MTINNPYHEGELAVQRRAGEADSADRNGAIVNDRIPAGAIDFIAKQPLVIAGSLDEGGWVWASALLGMPGFLRARDDRTLTLDLSQTPYSADDPFWANVKANPRIGLLIVDFGTRRRLRINGFIRQMAEAVFSVDVERAYPNCPKYIQRRRWKTPLGPTTRPAMASRRGKALEVSQQRWIGEADTFFVASAHPEQGVDASHRGGLPGFVQVLDQRRLRIPDFVGNSMFNTLGNFVSYPHAGLVFLDFDRSRVLQLSGRPTILWNDDDPGGHTGGTYRYWEFEVEDWRERELPFRLEWELIDYSPLLRFENRK